MQDIAISTDNKDWKGRPYQSDLVTLIKKDNVFFEVFEDEIIISFLSTHVHFENYSFGLKAGEPDFVIRAKEFLKQLFTLPIRHEAVYKGKKLKREKYSFAHPDGQGESLSGVIVYLSFIPYLFAKKRTQFTTWNYDKKHNRFTTTQPWKPSPNAIQEIALDNKYIEVFEKSGAFTCTIWYNKYDENSGAYYWTHLDKGNLSIFDTKEEAIDDAKKNLL